MKSRRSSVETAMTNPLIKRTRDWAYKQERKTQGLIYICRMTAETRCATPHDGGRGKDNNQCQEITNTLQGYDIGRNRKRISQNIERDNIIPSRRFRVVMNAYRNIYMPQQWDNVPYKIDLS